VKLGVSRQVLDDMEAEAMRQVDAATETAKASPPPPLELIDRDVWADGGSSWRN
jgi:pyruvate dehydrogenase E1 component alpha subunit